MHRAGVFDVLAAFHHHRRRGGGSTVVLMDMVMMKFTSPSGVT
jgi:hypothetical protein